MTQRLPPSTLPRLLFLALVACGGAGREAARFTEQAEVPRVWSTVGVYDPGGSETPGVLPFPAGQRWLDDRCGPPKATRAEIHPCRAEHLLSRREGEPEAREALFLRTGVSTLLVMDGVERVASGSWPGLGATLLACLGDPLALRPAQDPGATRVLVQLGEVFRWNLGFSGQGRCGLQGGLGLDALGSRVDVADLRVEERTWSQGGRERAEAWLLAENRARATEIWPTLPPDERILLLKALAEDPDPEAESVLRSLERLDPPSSSDIARALERRERHHARASSRIRTVPTTERSGMP
jgi:hypothetical protein